MKINQAIFRKAILLTSVILTAEYAISQSTNSTVTANPDERVYAHGVYPGSPAAAGEFTDNGNTATTGKSLFKVRPNPSSDLFSIESTESDESVKNEVEVISMLGDRVLSFNMTNGQKHEFSLAKYSAGIYFIRMNTGSRTEIAKIVRTN